MNTGKKLHLHSKEEGHSSMDAAAESQIKSDECVDFENVEDLLRFDKQHTTVPDAILERLSKENIETDKPLRSWWRKWF